MNVEELQAMLVKADAAYVEKTMSQPYFGAYVELGQSVTGWRARLYGRNDRDGMGDRVSGDFSATPESAAQSLIEAIAALPNLEDHRLREVQKDLATLIDKSREYGIDVEFVNPLEESMKRLSENILEGPA